MTSNSSSSGTPHGLQTPEPLRDADSIARRIARLETAEKRCRYVGTGFAGLVLLLGIGGLLDGVNIIRAIVVTLVIFGVASLGISVVSVLLELGRLRGSVVSRQAKETDRAGAYDPHPHYWYVAGVGFLTCGAVAIVAGTWLAVS